MEQKEAPILKLSDSDQTVMVPMPIPSEPLQMAPTMAGARAEARDIPTFIGTLPNPISHSWSVWPIGNFPSFTFARAQRGVMLHGLSKPYPDPKMPDYSPHDWKIGHVQMFSQSELDKCEEKLRNLWWRVDNLSGAVTPGHGKEIDMSLNRFLDLAAQIVESRRGEEAGLPAKKITPLSKEEARTISALAREDIGFLARLSEQPRVASMAHDVPVGCMVWLKKFRTLDEAYLYQDSFQYGSNRYPDPKVPVTPEWAALINGFRTTFEDKQAQINRDARAGGGMVTLTPVFVSNTVVTMK